MISSTMLPGIEACSRVRLTLLSAMLVAEVALVASLRKLGWVETGGYLRWALCAAAALLPLAGAVLLLVGKRLRFGLRHLLASMALMALFMYISVLPLLRAYEARFAVRRLQAAGVSYRLETPLEGFYHGLQIDVTKAMPSTPPEQDLPAWLATLGGDVARLPRDADIREIWIDSNQAASQFCETADRLTSLQSVGITWQVHPAAIEQLGLCLAKLPRLRIVELNGVTVSDEWLRAIPRAHTLFLWDESPRSGRQLPSSLLSSIATMPQWRVLMCFRYGVTDADIPVLAQSASLEAIIFKKTAVTDDGVRRLQQAMPGCKIFRN